jgi:hypothetical protein
MARPRRWTALGRRKFLKAKSKRQKEDRKNKQQKI